jgi:signal transduction histidine kinase
MIKAIANEVKRLQKNTKIRIKSSIENNSGKEYTTNEKIVVYRIFQEITNNCFKHAKASEINVSITTQPHFKMTVQDNGKGFDYNQIKNHSATLGIHNMSNRAAIINYDLAINTAIGEGTTIILSEKPAT